MPEGPITKKPIIKKLRARFNQRYLSQRNRAQKKKIPIPNKEELWQYLLKKYNEGFSCEYCDRKLLIIDYDGIPYSKVFSLDHRVSLDSGGTMKTSNFAITCNRCNILKSTISVEIYKKLIKPHLNNHKFLDQIHKEIWRGRFANQRERHEKND